MFIPRILLLARSLKTVAWDWPCSDICRQRSGWCTLGLCQDRHRTAGWLSCIASWSKRL